MNSILEKLQVEWKEDLFSRVIPFWSKNSLDKDFGGYFTCLDSDGSVFDDRKYVWLQGREVFMFSHLFIESSKFENVTREERISWLENARHGVEFMRKAMDDKGLVWFSLSRDGNTRLHYQRKPYAAVFLVMGFLEFGAALSIAKEENFDLSNFTISSTTYLKLALDLFSKVQEWIADPTKCGGQSTSGSSTRLADLMCEGVLAVQFLERIPENISKDVGLDREIMLSLIKNSMNKVQSHVDPSRKIFLENSSPDGPNTSCSDGRVFNPGHSIEVAWILLKMCKFNPSETHQQLALDVILNSLIIGWDDQYGGIYYIMDIEGKPFLDSTVTKNGKLWWPHCESLIACLLAYSIDPRPLWIEWVEKIHGYCVKHFIDKVNGEWFGYCNQDGSLLHKYKGGNYKGFFHVPRSLLMSIQISQYIITNNEINKS